MSAKVATVLLKGAPITKEEFNIIIDLIKHHEIPKGSKIVINNIEFLPIPKQENVKPLSILVDADAFAFFESTIIYFIREKAQKQSKEWIWERIFNNLKRLHPYLQKSAMNKLKQLPQDCKNALVPDWQMQLVKYLKQTQMETYLHTLFKGVSSSNDKLVTASDNEYPSLSGAIWSMILHGTREDHRVFLMSGLFLLVMMLRVIQALKH